MDTGVQRLLDAAIKNKALQVRNFADLARVIGESEQTLTNWKRRGIPRAKILPLSVVVGCDPLWLQFGDDRPYKIETTLNTAGEGADESAKLNLVVTQPSGSNEASFSSGLSKSGSKIAERIAKIESSGAASPQMYRAIEEILNLAEQNNKQQHSNHAAIRDAIENDE